MVVHTNIDLERLSKEGKNFNWEKPCYCPNCKNCSLWGHGFVLAYFDDFAEGCYLKRYRCICCGCVITLRPQGYWSRFRASITKIFQSLYHRLTLCKWPVNVSRQRGDHWLNNFIRKIFIDYGYADPLEKLKVLFEKGIKFLD
jgi:hypothetical protein